MNRPYVICHMVTSIDGKVTGTFLSRPNHGGESEIYYQINRDYKADAYACGRVTMQGSFAGDYYPDLSEYPTLKREEKTDFAPNVFTGFYAVSFDPHGRVGWKDRLIDDVDHDPGYDKAQIIEVLTEQVDDRYLTYLESLNIPYIFAGETEIDVELALTKLKSIFGIEKLLLEGGSILDGGFGEVDMVDELSLVVCPTVADTESKPLFMKSKLAEYALVEVKHYENSVLWLNYKRQRNN